jgi:hypothetical protein
MVVALQGFAGQDDEQCVQSSFLLEQLATGERSQ